MALKKETTKTKGPAFEAEEPGNTAVAEAEPLAAGEAEPEVEVQTAAEVQTSTQTAEEQAAAATRAAEGKTGTAHTAGDAEVAAASVEASTAIAKTSAGQLSLGGKYKPAFAEYQNVIDPTGIEFNTFTRVKVGLDGFNDENDDEMGKTLKIRLMSWNERFIITTGEDNAEANELVKYSLDGKTIDDSSESVADYLQALKTTHGYDDASVKKYYVLYGFLLAHSPEGELVDISDEDQSIVAIQVPPQSIPKFTRIQIEMGVKVSMGKVEATDVLVLKQNKVKGKNRQYAEILFSTK